MATFSVEPLSRGEIRAVYPLIREAIPGLSVTAWLRFAQARRESARGNSGIIVARREGHDFPSGLFCYRVDPDPALAKSWSPNISSPSICCTRGRARRVGGRAGCVGQRVDARRCAASCIAPMSRAAWRWLVTPRSARSWGRRWKATTDQLSPADSLTRWPRVPQFGP